MSSIRKSIINCATLFVIALSSGCALGPAREVTAQMGRVLDEETQQPIEGAIVVFRWQGVGTKAFVDTQTVCYHVESAVTDAEGRYVTTPWKEESRYRDLSMKQVMDTAYKAGYVHTRTDRVTGDQTLRRDARGVKERLEYLQRLPGLLSCGNEGEVYKIRGALDAIYNEATQICRNVSECDKKLLNSIRYQHDVVKYGWDATQERRRRGEYE